MGNFIISNKNKSSGKVVSTNKKTIIHRAKVLSPSEVEANRSSAYKYLTL